MGAAARAVFAGVRRGLSEVLTATLDPLIVVLLHALWLGPIPRRVLLRCFKPPRGPAALLPNSPDASELDPRSSIHTCGFAVRG